MLDVNCKRKTWEKGEAKSGAYDIIILEWTDRGPYIPLNSRAQGLEYARNNNRITCPPTWPIITFPPRMKRKCSR